MTGWSRARLGDVAEVRGGKRLPKGVALQAEPNGAPYVRIVDWMNWTLSEKSLLFVPQQVQDSIVRYRVFAGEIFISIVGSVGLAALVPPSLDGAFLTENAARVSPNPAALNATYLKYYLQSPFGQLEIRKLVVGSTQEKLALSRIRDLCIPMPNLDEQLNIAATLSALDDKIELNRRTIDKALDLAAALYERALSVGFQEVTVGDVAEFHNRRRIPLSSQEREERLGDIPYYGATGIFGYVNEALFDEILVLVGEDGSVVRRDGGPVLQYVWGRAWINNHAHPLSGRNLATELLYLALNRSDIRPLVTGAVQPKVSMGNLKRLGLLLPTEDNVNELQRQIDPIFAIWRVKADEIRFLEKLRDVLLPELLSGRIRLPDVTRLKETVA